MKLSQKLPLAFALALSLMLMGALFGIFKLMGAVETYKTDVMDTVRFNREASAINRHFATGIQEWKNVLLRGKNPEQLTKYWASHEAEMQQVVQGARAGGRLATGRGQRSGAQTGPPDGRSGRRLPQGTGSLQSG
ncbi:MAG: hypothetical protein WA174_11730 [Rhodoferax sp.]